MILRRPIFLVVLFIITLGLITVFGVETIRIAKKQELAIAVILKSNHIRSEFWQTVSAGARAAALELGIQTSITGPMSETDIDEQIRLLKEAIEKKPNAIIIAAIDMNKLSPYLYKAMESGIKLILLDTPATNIGADSLIATDHIEAGRLAAAAMVEQLTGGPAKVIVIGDSTRPAAEADRIRGIKYELDQDKVKNIGIEYAGTYYYEGTEDFAYELVRFLLFLQTDIQGFIGLSEPGVLGAARAIKENTRPDSLKLIGFDSSIYEIKLLEEGVLQATIVQKPFNMGYLSVETAIKSLNGIQVEKRVNMDTTVISKDNMYTQKNQELLFPLVEK